MLTPDQAVEAAFYTGCNLRSFTEEKADNLDWMGCERDDLSRTKAAAAAGVRDLADQGEMLGTRVAAGIVQSQLTAAGLIDRNALTQGQHMSFVAFVAVLRALDQVVAFYAQEAAAARRASAPVPPPAAYAEDPEDRIDALAPDPFETIDHSSLAPAARPRARRGR